jgi:predicted ArsR family transcriptional regulator
MEGWTISELAEKLGILPKSVTKKLERLGIKPVSREALYPLDVLKKLQTPSRMGRPPKVKPEAPANPSK